MASHRRAWLLLLLVALLGGCGRMLPPGGRGDLINYTVRPGDTLYSISWRYGYDHREVAAWNSIPPPYSIYPGQELLLIPPYQKEARERPAGDGAASAPSPAAAPSVAAPPATGRAAATTTTPSRSASATKPPVAIEKPAPSLQTSTLKWQWPTDGTVVNTYAPGNGKKGLDISARLGQAIFAAADGVVVYSGSGLIGYGNLIIIKHNDTYLSAYGHNRRLLVKEGARVRQGEKIAEMGDSGKDGIILHFEIRRDGKPVDPLRYLPKRR